MVICTAESGESRRYRIWFAVSQTNDAATPTPNDVLVKRLNGSYQLLFATTRKDVSVGIYNAMGRMIALEKVPTANPNDVSVATDSYGNEVLMDVDNVESGVVLDFTPNDIYYYTFFLSDREVIRSGKIVLL